MIPASFPPLFFFNHSLILTTLSPTFSRQSRLTSHVSTSSPHVLTSNLIVSPRVLDALRGVQHAGASSDPPVHSTVFNNPSSVLFSGHSLNTQSNLNLQPSQPDLRRPGLSPSPLPQHQLFSGFKPSQVLLSTRLPRPSIPSPDAHPPLAFPAFFLYLSAQFSQEQKSRRAPPRGSAPFAKLCSRPNPAAGLPAPHTPIILLPASFWPFRLSLPGSAFILQSSAYFTAYRRVLAPLQPFQGSSSPLPRLILHQSPIGHFSSHFHKSLWLSP